MKEWAGAFIAAALLVGLTAWCTHIIIELIWTL